MKNGCRFRKKSCIRFWLLIFKQIIVQHLRIVDEGFVTQFLLAQTLIALQKESVDHIPHIQEHQIIGQRYGILGCDLVAGDEFIVDQIRKLG